MKVETCRLFVPPALEDGETQNVRFELPVRLFVFMDAKRV